MLRSAVNRFKAPQAMLGDLDAEVAATMIEAAADVALVLDRDGIIRDLAVASDELAAEDYAKRWVGQHWVETVTAESRTKVEELLRDAAARSELRWRQVNHPSNGGPAVPVRYFALPLGKDGRIIAIGRDLRAMAMLQQRLVDAQIAMEREYARLRQAETRYRYLFQLTSEGVLVVDANARKVLEANPAAGRILGAATDRLVGRAFPFDLDAPSKAAVQKLMTTVLATGRSDEICVRTADKDREWRMDISLVRQQAAALFLVRVIPHPEHGDAACVPKSKAHFIKLLDSVPDGLVVTDPDGQILAANIAFLDLAQLATEDQARGQPLERFIGRAGVDVNVLMANLREHETVRLFATSMTGVLGTQVDVEISAVAVLQGDPPCFGFVVRNVGGRLPSPPPAAQRVLPRSVEQLTELVGRVPLKDLVRETTDIIERLCIEAALELTGDNRASAAEMLGLSRQSLYVKLRRYGMGELGAEGEG